MKDLFEELGDIFKPHFEKFEKLHEDLKQNIQKGIIEDLMNCKTIAEINAIEARDSDYFQMWPELLVHSQSARRRIKNVILTYIDIMGIETLN
jgi:hypothetical protein